MWHVEIQQRFHKARDDGGGEERLGVHHQRGGDVRPEEHEHYRAEGLADGHDAPIPAASNCGRGANVEPTGRLFGPVR